ncbi:hypothetical protein LY76DRAFT_326227 [Colletotrichum caudatum]|nr:hypothetical protein LY76DRAFT_326227 [Colletotrichum caudatum]
MTHSLLCSALLCSALLCSALFCSAPLPPSADQQTHCVAPPPGSVIIATSFRPSSRPPSNSSVLLPCHTPQDEELPKNRILRIAIALERENGERERERCQRQAPESRVSRQSRPSDHTHTHTHTHTSMPSRECTLRKQCPLRQSFNNRQLFRPAVRLPVLGLHLSLQDPCLPN